MPDHSPSGAHAFVVPLPFDYARTSHCERSRTYRCSRAVPIVSSTPAALARALVLVLHGYTRQPEIAIDLFASATGGATNLAHLRFKIHVQRSRSQLCVREAAGSSSVGLSVSCTESEIDLDAILPASHDVHFLARVGETRAFFHVAYDAQLFTDRTIAQLAVRFALLSGSPWRC
jgi:hypothetical protein